MEGTRREFLISGLGLLLFGCSATPDSSPKPIRLPVPVSPTTIVAPTPAVARSSELTPKEPSPLALSETLIRAAEEDVFRFNNYPLSLRQKMMIFWLNGQKPSVEYTRADGSKTLLTFEKAVPLPSPIHPGTTYISLERKSLTQGGGALVFNLKGEYAQNLGEGLPPNIKEGIRQMNFEHEVIVSIALINGLITVGRQLGLDFKYPSVAGPNERSILEQSRNYLPTLTHFAEAVAEVNDYLLTYPYIDKDPLANSAVWSKDPSTGLSQPRISGLVFQEAGLTYAVDQTIGPQIRRFKSLDELAQTYPSLTQISGYQDYLTLIKRHFSK